MQEIREPITFYYMMLEGGDDEHVESLVGSLQDLIKHIMFTQGVDELVLPIDEVTAVAEEYALDLEAIGDPSNKTMRLTLIKRSEIMGIESGSDTEH